jgi:hypothetical protein
MLAEAMENIIASDFEFDDARTASVVDDAESAV